MRLNPNDRWTMQQTMNFRCFLKEAFPGPENAQLRTTTEQDPVWREQFIFDTLCSTSV